MEYKNKFFSLIIELTLKRPNVCLHSQVRQIYDVIRGEENKGLYHRI